MKMRLGILSVFGFWMIVSCHEIKDCELESSTDYAITRFYEADSVDQYEKEVAFRSIRIGNFADTTTSKDTIQVLGLFLDPTDTLVTYLFETDSITYDLTLDYKPHLRIYYDECDPVYSYKLDTAYSSNFDSVVVRNILLDRKVPTNIEVYL